MSVDIRLQPLVVLIEDHPGWRPVLEGFGIDGRDGTAWTLRAAADRAGVDVATVVAALSGPSGVGYDCHSVRHAPVGALIDHITTVHHDLLRRELPRIGVLIDDVVDAAPLDGPLVDIECIFRVLRADLEPHLVAEETVVFPMCRDIAEAFSWPSFHCGPVSGPIEVVLHDHGRALDALGELRWRADELEQRVTDDVDRSGGMVAELVASIRRLDLDIQRHFTEEHDLLFPTILRFAEELRLV